MRDHLRVVEQQCGKRPEELDGPELPDELLYLWHWFIDLSNSRGSSGFGPSAITHGELYAWCRLNGLDLLPFELRAIRELDALYLTQNAGDKAKATK